MTDRPIHRINVRLDESIPFRWLPSHPKFGLMCNAISTVDVHVTWLRRKLGERAAQPRYLHTVRGGDPALRTGTVRLA